MTSRKRAEGSQNVFSAYLQIVADYLLEEGVFPDLLNVLM